MWRFFVAALISCIAVNGQISLAAAGGRVTARITNVELRIVLQEFASRTRIQVMVPEDICEEQVSAEFTQASPEHVLSQLLAGYDYFFYYRAAKGSPASLSAVWVYPKGEGKTLQPVPPEIWASSKELTESLADADPEVRAKAYEALLLRPDRHSRELVWKALRGISENNEDLRIRILSSAIRKPEEVPLELLTDLVRTDQSEQMRWLALDAAAHHTGSDATAQAALTDSSSAVRERAREILAERNPNPARREPEVQP